MRFDIVRLIQLVCGRQGAPPVGVRQEAPQVGVEIDLLRIFPSEISNSKVECDGSSWKTVRFLVEDILTNGTVLEEISVHVGEITPTSRILLGALQVGNSSFRMRQCL
jgi:hypothetical protein